MFTRAHMRCITGKPDKLTCMPSVRVRVRVGVCVRVRVRVRVRVSSGVTIRRVRTAVHIVSA